MPSLLGTENLRLLLGFRTDKNKGSLKACGDGTWIFHRRCKAHLLQSPFSKVGAQLDSHRSASPLRVTLFTETLSSSSGSPTASLLPSSLQPCFFWVSFPWPFTENLLPQETLCSSFLYIFPQMKPLCFLAYVLKGHRELLEPFHSIGSLGC